MSVTVVTASSVLDITDGMANIVISDSNGGRRPSDHLQVPPTQTPQRLKARSNTVTSFHQNGSSTRTRAYTDEQANKAFQNVIEPRVTTDDSQIGRADGHQQLNHSYMHSHHQRNSTNSKMLEADETITEMDKELKLFRTSLLQLQRELDDKERSLLIIKPALETKMKALKTKIDDNNARILGLQRFLSLNAKTKAASVDKSDRQVAVDQCNRIRIELLYRIKGMITQKRQDLQNRSYAIEVILSTYRKEYEALNTELTTTLSEELNITSDIIEFHKLLGPKPSK